MQDFQSYNEIPSNNDFCSNEQAPQASNSLAKTLHSSFSPFLTNTLKVESSYGFFSGAVCYSPKHNMIIACPANCTMQFYDATTLLSHKERENLKLDAIVLQMSSHAETDTYIIGCTSGYIYFFNASCNEIKKLKNCQYQVHTSAFLGSEYYVFSSLYSKKLVLGTLKNNDMVSFDSHHCDVFCLQHVPERKLLFSGVIGGSVIIYRTDKLPRLHMFCSVRAHLAGMVVFTAQRIIMNRKEYVITAGQERAVKIWHLVKGRMRLLRVIWTKEIPYSVVYLEDYKMLGIASECNYVTFLRLPSGRLERTVNLAENKKYNKHSLFVMKEKNMIGVTSEKDGLIEFIQLGGVQGGEKET